ncbi:MAG TPA: sigma-70 family RNA polymerase sigma factor, partial [Tissierellaceae bacterium]
NEPKISPKLYNEDDFSKIVVIQLCQQLPEEEKDIFYMRYIEGYNSTELGEIFNMSASTVRSRLSSARKKIANIYYDEGKKGD